MKNTLFGIFTLVAFLTTSPSWAKSSAICEIVNGFYANSSTPITRVQFETLADIFSLNNAQTLSLEIDSKEVRFQKQGMDVNRYTKMNFIEVNKESTQVALITIDRTPREVKKSKEFYASLLLVKSGKKQEQLDLLNIQDNSLTYNLYCRF